MSCSRGLSHTTLNDMCDESNFNFLRWANGSVLELYSNIGRWLGTPNLLKYHTCKRQTNYNLNFKSWKLVGKRKQATRGANFYNRFEKVFEKPKFCTWEIFKYLYFANCTSLWSGTCIKLSCISGFYYIDIVVCITYGRVQSRHDGTIMFSLQSYTCIPINTGTNISWTGGILTRFQ